VIASRGRATGSVLEQILAQTVTDLAERKRAFPVGRLERAAEERGVIPSLHGALSGAELSVVAEVKRASPSRGVFPVAVEPREVAAAYLAGGAAAISCLTDEPFFRGSLDDLRAVAEIAHAAVSPLPVLRKDFVIDPYQVVEAKAHGADAVLLIAAALSDEEMRDLHSYAELIGLEALVEVHDEAELARAVDGGASIIGINNRDLKTLVVDLAVTERLAPLVPDDAVVVGESGIFTADDAQRMARAGVHAVLVGEALILQADRAAAVQRLLGAQ
jgi:indole-3-glycerol phosphate synthase